ncbi:DUF72 domain-containing protein [Pedobacter sp. V48]|uniref:DUF72 domain-containing protein n=1 Tax=Pedobacter sp. V48 TaxID=509635 RepID=UPI0003E54C69|nr:DUF72 domain-containing protein [Pedobacter sp. V48]ETZ23026.1 hypothetical protein N824_20535 [Pedobacter sp. V48]
MLSKIKGSYYSGTSGLLLPVPNKQFYPEAFKAKSRLCYYGSLFNSIEINSSFYRVPLGSTVARWAGETPEDFRFTFKLSKEITHRKGFVFEPDAVRLFIERIAAIGNKKGCLLVQFPASIRTAQTRQVAALFACIRSCDPDLEWKVSVEFRHQSWYQQGVQSLLDDYQVGWVLHDKLNAGGYMLESALDFVYVRFHGPHGDYRGSYTDDFLQEYASYIRNWIANGKHVFTYFNNTIGSALEDLQSLRAYVNDH